MEVMRAAALSQTTPLCVKCSPQSGVESFPTGAGRDAAVRVLVCVRVVIDWHVCESVNHAIFAQMSLEEQLPAAAINCRWYR